MPRPHLYTSYQKAILESLAHSDCISFVHSEFVNSFINNSSLTSDLCFRPSMDIPLRGASESLFSIENGALFRLACLFRDSYCN
jgi:hypothetical protein